MKTRAKANAPARTNAYELRQVYKEWPCAAKSSRPATRVASEKAMRKQGVERPLESLVA
jgi:hypothetical protein